MTVEAGLLQAICEAPDDDTPRLIYADWLTDHGQPDRAEFIRAQIELANLPEKRTKKRRKELEQRIGELWAAHSHNWGAGPPYRAVDLRAWERGFLAWFSAGNSGSMAENLPRVVKEAPIQHVRLHNPSRDDIARLVELPALAHVRTLILWTNVSNDRVLTDADVPLLTECPYLTRLEHLDLTQHKIGPAGIALLANSPRLPRLCDLGLYANSCGDEGLRHIATSPMAARLRNIYATGVRPYPITAEGMRILATTPAFASLRVLRMESEGIRDAGARHLAGAAHFRHLTELYLHECGLTDAGVAALANSAHLKNLEVLDLSSNWTVGHAGAVALVKSPYLKHLRSLDLWRCERLSEADEKMLRQRFRNKVNFGRSY
jgi:uncharacterized protein (TIGR02996 family)